MRKRIFIPSSDVDLDESDLNELIKWNRVLFAYNSLSGLAFTFNTGTTLCSRRVGFLSILRVDFIILRNFLHNDFVQYPASDTNL